METNISKAVILRLIIEELPWLNIDTFGERKILQKTIYLLQSLGINLRYNYNWYIHGPYSPGLANDAYEIVANKDYYAAEIKNYNLTKDALDVIENYKRLFNTRKEDELWLELISSLLFLRKNFNRNERESLKEILLKKKTKFADYSNLDEALDMVCSLSA